MDINRALEEQVLPLLRHSRQIRVVYAAPLGRVFFQVLLEALKAGAQAEILLPAPPEALPGDLGPIYFRHFENAGGLLFCAARLPAPAWPPLLLLEEGALMPDPAAAANWHWETRPDLLHLQHIRFQQLQQQCHRIHLSESGQERPMPAAAVPVQIFFESSAYRVSVHERFELHWSVRGADAVQLLPEPGAVAPEGSYVADLEQTREFQLVAHSAGRQTIKTLKIEVHPAPKIEYVLTATAPGQTDTLALQPAATGEHQYWYSEGQQLRLFWRVYNAESVWIDETPVPFKGNMPLDIRGALELRLRARNARSQSETRISLSEIPHPATTIQLPAMAPDPVRIEIPAIQVQAEPPRTWPGTTASADTSAAPALRPVGPLYRFLWFCAGADRDLLRQCPPQDGNTHAGIGAAVLFTGLMAAFSGGYAFYVAFRNGWLAAGFALFWGLVIFNLDRLIVGAISKEGSTMDRWRQALPRMLLALMLALVISKPLELRIFESEILEVLEVQKQRKISGAESIFQEKNTAIDQKIGRIKQETQSSFEVRERLYQEYRCECDGTCGTGRVGRGSECARKELKYQQADMEYSQLKNENDRLIEAERRLQAQAQSERNQTLARLSDTHATGLLARLSASSELPFLPGLFISLLIFLLEVAPVISKVLSPAGPYERALQVAASRFNQAQEQLLTDDQQARHDEEQARQRWQEARSAQELEQQRAIWRLVSDAQRQLVEDQIQDWLQKQRKNKGKK